MPQQKIPDDLLNLGGQSIPDDLQALGGQASPEPPSLLSRGWHAISDPLTDAPSRFASSIADYIDSPSLDRSPFMAQMRGFGAGALQGIGDLVSGFTSPMSLATMGAGGVESVAAKQGLPRVAQLANIASKVASAPMVAHGASNIFSPDTSLAEKGFGLTEAAGGMAGMFHTPMKGEEPVIHEGAVVQNARVNSQTGETIIPGKTGVLTTPPEPETPIKGQGELFPEMGPKFESKLPQMDVAEDGSLRPITQAGLSVTDKYAKYRDVPVGTKYKINPDDKLPVKIGDAMKLGFEYKGLDDTGKLIIEKTKESPNIRWPEDKNAPTDASTLADIANLPRTLMASEDFSAPLRQGLGLIHKKQFWTALPEMFRAFGSEKSYEGIQQAIAEKPLFAKRVTADGTIAPSFAEEAGLKFTNLNSISQREESMMSKMAEKIPGVRRSERAYTVFLNKVRADVFEQMVNDFGVFKGEKPTANLSVAKDIANFVNNASGRGNLGFAEPAAKVLSTALFSPRLIASRLQLMTKGVGAVFSPETYVMSQPSIRREYLKSLFSIAALGGSFGQLARMAGGSVESDPASSDFGKIKLGNLRIDPYGGFQQYIVLAQRLMPHLDLSAMGLGQIGGTMKSTTTNREYDLGNPKFGQSSRADVALRFVRSKTNPIVNFAWGLLAGQKELSGKPMDVTTMNPMNNSVAQRFIPMLMQDIYDMVQDETTPLPAKVLGTGLGTFGMGTQTYGGR